MTSSSHARVLGFFKLALMPPPSTLSEAAGSRGFSTPTTMMPPPLLANALTAGERLFRSLSIPTNCPFSFELDPSEFTSRQAQDVRFVPVAWVTHRRSPSR